MAWEQQAYVKTANPGPEDGFGFAVALSADGDTLAVGAPYEDGGVPGIDGDPFDEGANLSGAAYVFTRAGATWSQQAYVKSAAPEPPDMFGASVALSGDGNTLAVAAWNESSAAVGIDGDPTDNSAEDAGAVFVYARAGETWSQHAYIKASNTGGLDMFGTSVALAFDRAGEEWSQRTYVKASNASDGDKFGHSVALSADGATLAVGARDESSAATGIGGDPSDDSRTRAGAVYLY